MDEAKKRLTPLPSSQTYEEREKEREKRKQERKREFKEQTKDHAEAVIESLRQVYREQTGGGDIGKKARVVLEGLLTVKKFQRTPFCSILMLT